jgi:hypothetical protein
MSDASHEEALSETCSRCGRIVSVIAEDYVSLEHVDGKPVCAYCMAMVELGEGVDHDPSLGSTSQ